MSMPRRHLSRRLTAAGIAIFGVVALGGCASNTTVTDKDFNHSSSGGGNSGGNDSTGGNDSGGTDHRSDHDGTIYVTSRHSQKVVVRNESNHVVHSTTMSRGERVKYSLPPGVYTIVATSSGGVCVVTVSVQSSATTKVTVGC
jgi:hypothetical protein